MDDPLPEVDIQVQSGHGAPFLKWMELDCQVLLGHFGPVYLLQVSMAFSKSQMPNSCQITSHR